MLQNLDLQEICNLIILVSAVIIAAKNIYGFLKKPVDTLHDREVDKEEQHIESVIQQRMPKILEEHGAKVQNERRKEDEAMAEVIKESVVEAVSDKIEELKEITLDQGTELKNIQKSVDLLNSAQMDLMRYNMNNLYYKYRPYKKILDCDKKAFMKFYNDYHSMGGNTWIDQLYNEVIHWEIVEDESELKLDN